jgi:spore germination protein GerM
MSRGRLAAIVGGVVAVVLVGWLGYKAVSWYRGANANVVAATAAPAPQTPGRKIKARLLYIAEDGMRLTAVERDVAFGEEAVEQAREIIAAQVGPVAEPLVSAIPPGTAVRALFITDSGQAFVDLSGEVATRHSGGSTSELLTVYTIVNALTANLPAVTSVQILIDGKEVDTLAGHVDLRRPLAKNLEWVQ